MNLFVWPARDRQEHSFVNSGLSVTEWSRDGIRFAAVADFPRRKVLELEALLLQRSD